MDNSQRQMFKHQIQLLQTQIEQQRKREQVLRTLNETLEEQYRIMAAQKDQYQEINEQLTGKLKNINERHMQELKYYETENSKLKAELSEQFKDAERKDIESQRRQLMLEQKISMLESIIEKKCNKVGDLQKKLHDQSIYGFKQSKSRISCNEFPYSRRTDRNTDLAVSAIQYSPCDTENNMKYSNLSTSRQSKVSQLMKLDKSQLKCMMGAVLKSKKYLEQGSSDISICGDSTKRNKTFCD